MEPKHNRHTAGSGSLKKGEWPEVNGKMQGKPDRLYHGHAVVTKVEIKDNER